MGDRLDDALDECLEMLASGAGADQCLARYPDYSEELAPLLTTASRAMSAAWAAGPRAGVKERGLSVLAAAVNERGVPTRGWSTWMRWPLTLPRPALAAMLVLFAATGLAVGSGAAAADSVPGEPLYWVKSRTENLSMMLPRSDMAKAEAHARLAAVRTGEMRRLSGMGRFDLAEGMIGRIQYHLGESAGFAGVTVIVSMTETPLRSGFGRSRETVMLRTSLMHDMDELRSGFEQLIRTAPLEFQGRIRTMKLRSQLGYYVVISAMDDSPSVSVPQRRWSVE